MKAYGKQMVDLRDIYGHDYPSRRMFGRKRLKALKRKLRSRKKEERIVWDGIRYGRGFSYSY